MRQVSFDKIAVYKLTADMRTSDPHITARIAFVNSKTGKTYGTAKLTQLSVAARRMLEELTRQIESDAESVLFIDGPVDESTSGWAQKGVPQGVGGGIGELLTRTKDR